MIISTQANQALSFLPDAHPDLARALRGVEYERSHLVLHTDARLMPKVRADWKSVNFILEDAQSNKDRAASATTTSVVTPSSPSGRAVRYATSVYDEYDV